MPLNSRPFKTLKVLLGIDFWRLQLALLGIAVAVTGLFWLLQGIRNPAPQFLFTFIIGNCTTLAVVVAVPLFGNRKFPWDWVVYLSVLIPVSAVASLIASVANRILAGRFEHLFRLEWGDIRIGTFTSLVSGTAMYISARAKGAADTTES